jgi:hypothetical protein
MSAINVLFQLKRTAWPRLLQEEKDAIEQALAIPESAGEQAIREGDEMMALAGCDHL